MLDFSNSKGDCGRNLSSHKVRSFENSFGLYVFVKPVISKFQKSFAKKIENQNDIKREMIKLIFLWVHANPNFFF